ncbi:MAG: AMP-binding protein [Candidatus Peribacteria bacterium]|nr:AMP-binding protein [Candidatus Peribacteria bacterium]
MKNNLFLFKKIYEENDFYKNKVINFSFSNFEELPFISSKEISQLYSSNTQKGATVFFTGGTSGKPKAIYYSQKDVDFLSDYISWFCKVENIKKNEKIMVLMDQSFWGVGCLTNLGHIKAGNKVIPVDNDLPKSKIKEIIQTIKPKVISSLPSVLLEISDIINDYKFDLIETTGEKLTDDIRTKIENIYGGKVFDAYGMTEIIIGTECKKHDGYHYNNNRVYLEIIDKNGENVKNGEWGELVITSLNDKTTPIIRYLTGDLCKISNNKCECGLKYPKVWIKDRIDKTFHLCEGYKIAESDIKNIINSVKNGLFVSAEVHTRDNIYYQLTINISKHIPKKHQKIFFAKLKENSYELMHMIRHNKLKITMKYNEK